jgi:hypothetical protein
MRLAMARRSSLLVECRAGDVVEVPLTERGAPGVGVVAAVCERAAPGRRVVFCYGFAPLAPGVEIASLRAPLAVFCGRTGDSEIASKRWRVVGRVEPFAPGEWPWTPTVMYDSVDNWAELRHYESGSLTLHHRTEKLSRATPEEISRYPEDDLLHPLAFEQVLRLAIDERWPGRRPLRMSRPRSRK